jgi:hypothetical protein
LERAGLPAGHRDMFHKLRRTTATMFAAKGGDASHLLGHTSIKHLQRYLDETMLDRATPAKLLPAMNQPIGDRRIAKTELDRLIDDFLASEAKTHRRGGTVSPGTRKHIQHSVSRLVRMIDAKTVADLKPKAIASLYQRLSGQFAANTLKVHRYYWLRFLRWLVSEGHTAAQGAIDALERCDAKD